MKKVFTILFAAVVIGSVAFTLSSCDQKKAKGDNDDVSKAEKVAKHKKDSLSAPAGSVVYFDYDRVLEEYDMANEKMSIVEDKNKSISDELNRKGSKIQKDYNALQEKINKNTIIPSVAQQQGEKWQQDYTNFQNYAAQKQQEMAEEIQVTINAINDAINTFVAEFNAEKKYAMIICTTASSTNGLLSTPVVNADPCFDITDAIIAGLNAEYLKSKSNPEN